ncbi:MAG: alkaline shock response membrane anchor protein AmaP [Candidatus Omnitrophota bacterium]|nr:alkaline shock response membrane anchor protein AmaP [Candidatus Omnitrophota bacterium]MDZ4241746.1 alkaline shock response membrane anchor protein AmaP [Candidatus Omnitrophota bacterium]
MRFMAWLGLWFYKVAIALLAIFFAFFVFQKIGFQDVVDVLYVVYHEDQARVITGAAVVVVLFLNFLFSSAISGRQQREKTIAFDNPSGRVTVSLAAVEDLIKRVTYRIPEVKEIRPTIVATKKGLNIAVRVALNSDVSIPEVTARLQETIKRKIQETIGLDESVNVKIDIVKILTEDRKSRHSKDKGEADTDANLPFQGYRA